LHRCADRRWLSGDGIEPIDPDVQEDRIAEAAYWTGGREDGYWHLLADEDPAEAEKSRTMQKVYLARYARISPFEWEHRDVTELDQYFAALAELIQKENTLSRASEDR
jgi:hypothetical protein